jgi:nucleoporin POM152
MAPETCKVFERPIPTASIEWKRIHEWYVCRPLFSRLLTSNLYGSSGDTGVSASAVFHGTPPFTVYYRTQRNKEPPKELAKIFPTSRGELTLQPPHSGHYTYTFTHLSDAYYTSVPLNGPSIDQVVHPLSTAVILNTVGGGAKRLITSCSGNLVDVDIELFVSPRSRSRLHSSFILLAGKWPMESECTGCWSQELGNASISWNFKLSKDPADPYTGRGGQGRRCL